MMEPLYMNWLTLLLNIVVIGVSQKHFASNRNSSNKGRITFQKHITYVDRIMRFFVKKSQKEKKSGLYISQLLPKTRREGGEFHLHRSYECAASRTDRLESRSPV